MYPFFALFFFSSATYVLIFFLIESKSPPFFGTFIVINAIVYFYFIIYFIAKSILKIKISFREIGFIKKLSSALVKFELLKTLILSTLNLIYMSLIAITTLILFVIFIYPSIEDYILEKMTSKNFSSDIYEIRANLNHLQYDIKDLKRKLYFSQNPDSYEYEDDDYIYKLVLDTNELLTSVRNDYYLYDIQIFSKKSKLLEVGWQSGGIELHQSEAKNIDSTVKEIKGDHRSFPVLNDKEIFVITVIDKDIKKIYIIYPKESQSDEDYENVKNLEFLEGMIVTYTNYEFLENEGKIRLFLSEPLNGSSSVIVTFRTDDQGRVIVTKNLERTS